MDIAETDSQTRDVAVSAAPPPARAGSRLVVAPDVRSVEATLRFDAEAREAEAEAAVELVMEGEGGHPALDLRQELRWARLDGRALPPEAWQPEDLGGGPGAEIRVLDVPLEAGSRHLLEVGYRLATPDAAGAVPIGWVEGGARFDLWMSDLSPGRYLEMWAPAPLCHDRFTLTLHLELLGSGPPHSIMANTAGVDVARDRRCFRVRYPAHFTSLSPMLVIAPSAELELRRTAVALPNQQRSLGLACARFAEVDVDLEASAADIGAWLSYLAARYGPWAHGDTFWAVLWQPRRGMEYDGATTASPEAIEHEVLHSWFGRGVKPCRATDGWIDEAWASWATSSGRSSLPRFATFELGLDEAPVQLYLPHPWARRTPVEAYSEGARLFGGLAHLLGGPARLRSAMAAWYRANAGKLVRTDDLASHLQTWSSLDISPWWDRYVHGRG